MNQEKILLQIETGLADLKSFMRKLQLDSRLHKIDVDLIKQKIRNLYDSAILLEADPEVEPKATVSDIKKQETLQVDEEYDDSFHKEKRWNETKDDVLRAEDLVTESHDEENEVQDKVKEGKEVETEKVVEQKQESVSDKEVFSETEKTVEPEKVKKPETKEKVTGQPDLFSASETLADKLSGSSKSTVAEKLVKGSLTSLKEFIGINDKFLFINELFKGDMRNYTNALNELDSLKTLDGAFTYLFELKIQNQWDDELEAYIKLKELIEKKFAE